jgi:hypothetical protein
MINDVTQTDECTIHSHHRRNGLGRFWPRPRNHGWSDPRARYSTAGDVAVNVARAPR